MTTLTLNVSGMKCGACEKKIVEGLSALEGVESVKADHKAACVEVNFDSEKTSEEVIREKITELGFEVVEDKSEEPKESVLKQILKFFRS